MGIETTNPPGRAGESAPRPDGAAGETDRRGLRFQPGDRPIEGAD